MSALGHKQTLRRIRTMSALPPKADIAEHGGNVRFVPKADSCTAANGIYWLTSPASATSIGEISRSTGFGSLYIDVGYLSHNILHRFPMGECSFDR
jgi:hypothetical protein